MKSSTGSTRTSDPITATLVRRRKELGLPQQIVAKRAGISRRALVSIEAGNDCTLSTVRALCGALGVTLQTSVQYGASHPLPARSFRSAAEMSSYQEDRELAEAMRVQSMSPAELSNWLATGWDRLQKQADALYAGVGRPATQSSRHFKTIEDKNRFDEDQELQFAVARLRSALFEAEKQVRIANLPDLVLHKSPSVRLFARIAFASMNSADPSKVNWEEVEARVIDAAMAEPGMTHADVANALCELSPGAVFPSRQAAVRKAAALALRK